MHLKSLELVGFKSFPEKTVIEFNRGITAIVGPNGSGKSNITDAIRWVLGEQSVRTLRGGRMEDIIFSGTQSRRAMSYAEVTITIDNADGRLPMEYAEIQVTRRLFRSGESEYLLNRTACRLKDITAFFMDTGLGRDGYSIVGQGKVDSILSNRPEERRKVFEEASGIVRYKSRKQEAERRLQATEQNLVRIDDILTELSLQIGPLEEQAERARTYLHMHDELRETEIALFLDTIRRSSGDLAECDEQIRLAEEQIRELQEQQAALREQHQQMEEESRTIDEQVQESHRKAMDLSARIGSIDTREQVEQERIAQIRSRMSNDLEQREELERRIAELEQELERRAGKRAELERVRGTYDDKLKVHEREMEALLQSLGERERAEAAIQDRIERYQDQLYDKREMAGQTRGQTGLIDQRIAALGREITTLISDKDKAALQSEEVQSGLDGILQQLTAFRRESEEAQERVAQARDAVTERTRGLEEKKTQREHCRYRITTLEELERSREGYHQAVRAVLKRESPGVIGTVGDLFRVSERYEMAVETALGNAVQNIVTEEERSATAEIDFLKSTRQGRATFMPLTTVRGRRMDEGTLRKASRLPGFEGLAVDRVTVEPRFQEVAANLLGRIILADSMDHALAMARTLGFSVRIITLEGEVLLPGGAITGGYSRSRVSGLLGRAREIERLKEQEQELTEDIRKLEKEIPELDGELLEAGREQTRLEQAVTEQDHLRVREESRRAAMREDEERMTSRLAMLNAEKEQLDQQKVQVAQEAAQLETEAKEMETAISELRTQVRDAASQNKTEQQQLDDLRDTVSELRISVQSVVESLNAAEEMEQRITGEVASLKSGMERSREQTRQGESEIGRREKELAELKERRDGLERDVTAVREEAERQTARKAVLEQERQQVMHQLEESGTRIGSLQVETGRVEARKARVEATLDEYRNRLWEDYELTYDNAGEHASEVDSPDRFARLAQELRRAMRELGDVNIASIEEHTRVKERYEFMKGQRDDICEARDKLTGVIRDLTREMKSLFLDQFHKINENFDQVFRDLFGGGTAEVVLEDEEDVLDSGIEIRAQPPGKKLQNLMPLSGGERSLTAIALLFAILKLRPTPFCVLDEIESALDDANIYMFTDYVRRYREDSQFILVTHRKGTMEAAESIYGVTMQERGISRILSMRMADA